jgi:hypothetical protein
VRSLRNQSIEKTGAFELEWAGVVKNIAAKNIATTDEYFTLTLTG